MCTRWDSRAQLSDAERAAISLQRPGAAVLCKPTFADASKLSGPKTHFFSPAAETTVSETLAKEMPSVSRRPVARARLLSTCRGAGGGDGSWEALVNAAGK